VNSAAVDAPRTTTTQAIALPAGYRIEAVARGLTFPTGVAFDEQGGVFVVESGYSPKDGPRTTPRLVRVGTGGAITEVARGGDNGPWNGVAFHGGSFYVVEGGKKAGGKVLRIEADGRIQALVENLPSLGDHDANGPAIGPDGSVYFGIGTATNSGVVGEDNLAFGWLADHPEFHDIPCEDVVLRGVNYATRDLRRKGSEDEVESGVYMPFGTASTAGQVVAGQVPCTGAVMRVGAAGGQAELVAWGFRNPFGLAFSPSGKLYVTDNSYDVRGSRPVYGTGDLLWELEPGRWYGWPDYHGRRGLDDGDHFAPPGRKDVGRVLEKSPPPPPAPAAVLGVHSSSNGFDFATSPEFGHVGDAFVAQFGDMAPMVGKVLTPVGFKVVRVDVQKGTVEDFAVNGGDQNGPASMLGNGGLERPIAARFDPTGSELYVVDFGVLGMTPAPEPKPATGVLWRIRKSAAQPVAMGGGS
jgi:glucose/arabinose dehydrogenase